MTRAMTRVMTRATRAALGMAGRTALLAFAIAACDNGNATPDWSRMITQPKLLPYGETELFADQRAMRPVPAGTVPRGWIADPARRTGRTDAGEVTDVPLPVTRALLERGRQRFTIACATCHGTAGDGVSAVARNMQRRRPPSLYEPRIVALTPGALYRVIVDGYGLMPSYAKLLEPDDRWAVIAYVRTLALSRTARLDALPPAIRDEAARRLGGAASGVPGGMPPRTPGGAPRAMPGETSGETPRVMPRETPGGTSGGARGGTPGGTP
jgi:mono/diheme cytochrome c family protein